MDFLKDIKGEKTCRTILEAFETRLLGYWILCNLVRRTADKIFCQGGPSKSYMWFKGFYLERNKIMPRKVTQIRKNTNTEYGKRRLIGMALRLWEDERFSSKLVTNRDRKMFRANAISDAKSVVFFALVGFPCNYCRN